MERQEQPPQKQSQQMRFLRLSDIRKIVAEMMREAQAEGDSGLIARAVDYEIKLQQLTEQNRQLKEQLASGGGGGDSKALEEENKRLRERISELTRKLAASDSGSSAEAAQVKKELEELQENYRILYGYYEELQKENERLTSEVKTLASSATRAAKLNEELEHLKKKLKEAEDEGGRHRRDAEAARQLLAESQKVFGVTVKELENRVKSLEEELRKRKNE